MRRQASNLVTSLISALSRELRRQSNATTARASAMFRPTAPLCAWVVQEVVSAATRAASPVILLWVEVCCHDEDEGS